MGVPNKRTRTKTRRYTRDIDQIKADLSSPKHLAQYKNLKAIEDLPGLGRWYCVECAKWFESQTSLNTHKRGKPHRRRTNQLLKEPYSQEEAEAAIGMRTDNKGPKQATEQTTDQMELTT